MSHCKSRADADSIVLYGNGQMDMPQNGRSCNSCLCACRWVHIKTILIHLAQLSDAGSIGSCTCDEKSDRRNHKPLREFINTFYLGGAISVTFSSSSGFMALGLECLGCSWQLFSMKKDLIYPHYATCQSANSRKVESATSW